MADSTESHLDSEGDTAKWIINISDFIGSLFKRYQQIDMFGVLSYLCNKMRDDKAFTLAYVLQSVVKGLFGW